MCLSLLGTFSSGNASERWNPTSSSLFQVDFLTQQSIPPAILLVPVDAKDCTLSWRQPARKGKTEKSGSAVSAQNFSLTCSHGPISSAVDVEDKSGPHLNERHPDWPGCIQQVLLSIQGMILIGDPYFNEPSVDQMRGTSEGAATSSEYNFGVGSDAFRSPGCPLLSALVSHQKGSGVRQSRGSNVCD